MSTASTSPKLMDEPRFVLFLAIGIALLAGAAYSAWSTREFLRTAITVPGAIAQIYAENHPDIEFVTKAGERILFSTSFDTSDIKVGDQVTVLYRADAPQWTATLDRFDTIWALTLFLSSMGSWFVLVVLLNISPFKVIWDITLLVLFLGGWGLIFFVIVPHESLHCIVCS